MLDGASPMEVRVTVPAVDGSDVIVGLDVGGTSVNATVLEVASGRFVVETMCESPSRVLEGPPIAMAALRESFAGVLSAAGIDEQRVSSVGLGTPGPASAGGVLSSQGSTNFSGSAWFGYDIRLAAEQALGKPVVYSNDGNAAALYAHAVYFGPLAASRILGIGGGRDRARRRHHHERPDRRRSLGDGR